jgi:circadian clock protein KaiC
MTKPNEITRLETGVRNLDAIVNGGLPTGSVTVISGPPGSGKTILAQQICFHHAAPKSRVLYFSTLSEPTAKTLRYLKQFSFFDQRKLDAGIQFVDLGVIVRTDGLEQTSALMMEHLKKVKPGIVVIDSFKTFDDLAKSKEELRKFSYEIGVNLMAWETTSLLLGEYGPGEYQTNPLFSIIDGLIGLSHRESSGELQRFCQVHKMRGTNHSSDEHSFVITSNGIEVFAPRVIIQRGPQRELEKHRTERCQTGISKLDEVLGEGIPRGSSLLIAGVAGTGKTVLLLEFIYRGAKAGEKGIVFSFEETEERLRATARGMGWDLEREIDVGMAEIVFVPQPNIMVEGHLLMMQERIAALGAKRVAIDSVSVFLHKVKDPQIAREKVFQLASIVQNTRAVGFFATDIPYGSSQISRFGVEETVVDGVMLLTSTEEALERQRYLEVYKLRNTAHLKGRHNMVIGKGGVSVFPRYDAQFRPGAPPPALDVSRRLSSGVPGLDELLGGGLLARSTTIISGSPGSGKSTLALQFILQGMKRRERGLVVTLEEGPAQLLHTAKALGLPLKEANEKGLVEILYLSREYVRAAQFLTILADKIRERRVSRLVLDGASHVVADSLSLDALRELLFNLATRFKMLGVTCLFTLESKSMYSTQSVTDQGFSPVADNLIMLRYAGIQGERVPTLTVVKTRGSLHDRNTYRLNIGKGGIQIGERVLIDGVGATTESSLLLNEGPSVPSKKSRRGGKRTARTEN